MKTGVVFISADEYFDLVQSNYENARYVETICQLEDDIDRFKNFVLKTYFQEWKMEHKTIEQLTNFTNEYEFAFAGEVTKEMLSMGITIEEMQRFIRTKKNSYDKRKEEERKVQEEE